MTPPDTLTGLLCRLVTHLTTQELPEPLTVHVDLSEQSVSLHIYGGDNDSALVAQRLIVWADSLVEPSCTVRACEVWSTASKSYPPSAHITVAGQITGGLRIEVMCIDVLDDRFEHLAVGEIDTLDLAALRSWSTTTPSARGPKAVA
jgi:hypothetical protein